MGRDISAGGLGEGKKHGSRAGGGCAFDRDGKEEAAVILRPEGGAHWAREELHILDEDEEGRILDTSFPLDALKTGSWKIQI